jgi:hypothetical protein
MFAQACKKIRLKPEVDMPIPGRVVNLTLSLAAALALTSAACSGGAPTGVDRGRVRVALSGDGGGASFATAPSASSSDALGLGDGRPSRWFSSANVTLSSVLARNSDGVLVNLELDLPVVVDVVKIEGGKEVLLPDGGLPVGLYDQVVIVMTAVQGVTHNGTVITVQPPGGGWTSVIPICPILVTEGGATTVALRLMWRSAFRWHGNNAFGFHPHFRPLIDCDDDDDDDDEEGN